METVMLRSGNRPASDTWWMNTDNSPQCCGVESRGSTGSETKNEGKNKVEVMTITKVGKNALYIIF